MADNSDHFENYVETTVHIGEVMPLFVVGAAAFLFFVPLVVLSIRPSEEIDEDENDCGYDTENGGGDRTSVRIGKTPTDSNEAIPLLLSYAYNNGSEYGGTSPGNANSIYDRFSLQIPSSPGSRRNGTLNSSPGKSVRKDNDTDDEEIFDDEEGRSNAIRFSDPKTGALEKLRIITSPRLDPQTKAMLSVGVPLLVNALAIAASEFVAMAVVGHQLGTVELSAYVVVDLLIKLASDAVGYVLNSGNLMVSQIVEANDKSAPYKIGVYVQLSILFYVVGMVPVIVFWAFCMKDVLLFLQLDSEIAEEGQKFATLYSISILLQSIASTFQSTMDVVGLQVQSMIITLVDQTATALIIVVVLCSNTLFPEMTLVDLGWLFVVLNTIYVVVMLVLIHLNGWFKDHYAGFFSSPLSMFRRRTAGDTINNESGVSRDAVKLMISNAFQFALAEFLYQGEWQILLFFASSLGPAEVAAWGVLGIIWEDVEYLITAIADGCEIRIAAMLGNGDYKAAKLLAYRSIWIVFCCSLCFVVAFLLLGDQLPKLVTTDPVLHEMVLYSIPTIALAEMFSSIYLMAEHILWCQNRAPLCTVIATATSVLVTLPVAGLSSCLFHFEIIGQTTAVALGTVVFSAFSMHAIITSDWKQISEDVASVHVSDGGDDTDDDEK